METQKSYYQMRKVKDNDSKMIPLKPECIVCEWYRDIGIGYCVAFPPRGEYDDCSFKPHEIDIIFDSYKR